ncbi:MAG: M81 family metallopeptidase [Trueperaceae bacterium]
MRIAIGGLHAESTHFSPVPLRFGDFTVQKGNALLRDPHLAALTEPDDVEPVGTLFARCLSGGPVERETYETLKTAFVRALQAAGSPDGLWLALHGGTIVAGMDDAEGDWIAAAREAVGPACVVVASCDLHGNLSPRGVRHLDGLVAFRTAAPHVDVHATHRRAVAAIQRAVRSGVRPVLAGVRLPLLVPGERAASELPAARDLFSRAAALAQEPGIWDASVLIGSPFADEPRAGAAAVVMADDEAVATDAVRQLARATWERRDDFDFAVPSGPPEACLRDAVASAATLPPGRFAVVSDSGDNPGAGGVGDRADLLRAALDLTSDDGPPVLIAGIAAPAAVASLATAQVGDAASVAVGGQLTNGEGPTVRLHITLLGRGHDPRGGAVVRLACGRIEVVLSERRRPAFEPAELAALGWRPEPGGVAVVKAGYLPAGWAERADARWMAVTEGAVTHDLTRLTYRRVVRPVHPFDPVPDPFAGEGPDVVLNRPSSPAGRTRPGSRPPAG